MTSSLKNLVNVKLAPLTFIITLPTGDSAVITHVGDVILPNRMKLTNVLHVPQFKHNLLSIHKLAKDSKCDVTFYSGNCVITDSLTKNIIGVGEMKKGLYYLKREKVELWGAAMISHKEDKEKADKTKANEENMFDVWHQRLGHASVSRLQHIEQVKPYISQKTEQVCLTCLLSKMTRLAFPVSSSHAPKAFDLLHVDIWGPYKVSTRGKFRFFLTLVDDYSRMTWVYLLEKNLII